MRTVLLVLLVGACSSDPGLPPLTHDTSLKCPLPDGLPFRTATTGFQVAQNETLASGEPRSKDQASDTVGNPGGLVANIYTPDASTAANGPVTYHGVKARTAVTAGYYADALPGEKVSLWTYDGMVWTSIASATTDADGAYDLPATDFIAANKQPLYSMLEADGSCAEHYTTLLPAGSKVVITDIDGTLTTDDNQVIDQIPDATYVPVAMGSAVELMKAWDAKNYPIIYLTARPHVLRVESRGWLRDEGFPNGALITAIQTEEASAYKTAWLQRIVTQFGWVPVAAYGNAQTDITAYNNVGIPKDKTFIVGPLAGSNGTQPIGGMDFATHIAGYVAAQPAN
ncbi:hypothetical protein BH11MYX1_BH11MYX1_45610 [soil metagenome]